MKSNFNDLFIKKKSLKIDIFNSAFLIFTRE